MFVASSMESIDIARALQTNLQRDAEVSVWDQDVFHLSRFSLESLLDALSCNDFGVIVFGPDDAKTIRGASVYVPRDNVVLEMGMFLGRMGRERVFFLQPESIQLHLPSDLNGLVYATFEDSRSDGNLTAATAVAANQIRSSIRRIHNFEGPLSEALNLSHTQVGAFCYKIEDNVIKVRLVATSSHRYSFPKGWVRDDESIPQALTRICREKAGVAGTASDELISEIKHRKYGQNEELKVVVFPFVVEAESEPLERYRIPKWYGIDEALELLTSGRTREYADGYRKFIDMARSIIEKK